MSARSSVLHYSILDQLGAGAMGVVYRAVDTRLDRVVALKFLPHALAADARARLRLVQEARAAARLDHPNIGVIYGIEGLDAEPFIVMACYEGQNLRDVLADRLLTVPEAVEWSIQLARGLERAHRSGIVHRDIKPANVLLTPDGVMKILDFGLAREGALEGLTRPGDVVGTPAYLSPEQARGQGVDGRTDLWALGAVLYEMLTGVAPFASDAGLAAMLLRIVSEAHEPASRLRPEVPGALDAIIDRALAKDLDARYASAREMIEDLGAVVTPAPPSAVRAAAPRPPAVAQVPAPRPQPGAPPPRVEASSSVARAQAVGLPAPASPLVGRRSEMALATLHLRDPHCRILTLFGAGGTGKTRLAVEVANELLRGDDLPDGVVFVPLDAVERVDLIPMRIALTLGLTLQGESDVSAQVAGHIGPKCMLLVLDNFEHLMAGADIPAELTRGCPGLTVLVTSRERLDLAEEWVLPVAGLQTPEPSAARGRDEALTFEAVQLFVQRATRADVRFALSDDDLPHVCEVCHLVHGSPLGVELAAAWVKMIPCAEIAREIRANLDFLESSSRSVSARQRSLRATFEYSWDLLSAREQEALRRLSVFHGGFTRQAAADVTGTGLRQLASLVDKSLLRGLPTGRYEFHPLIHQYAREKLCEHAEELADVRDAHGRHYLRLLRSRSDELEGRGQSDAFRTLQEDLQNLRAAWAWAVEGERAEEIVESAKPLDLLFDNKGRHQEVAALYAQAVEGLDAANALHHEALGAVMTRQAWAYFSLGRLVDARPLAERALELLRPKREGMHLLAALNTLAAIDNASGNFHAARDLWEEALALAGQGANRRHVSAVLGNLASVEQRLGAYEESKRHQQEALRLAREEDDQVGIVRALNNVASLLVPMGEFEEARSKFEEALEISREIGFDTALPILLHGLGVVHYEQHEYDAAEPYYREALDLARAHGDEAREAHILASIAGVHIAAGDHPRAADLLRAGLRMAWSNRDLPTALRCLGWFSQWHAAQGRLDEAVAWLTMVSVHPAADRHIVDANDEWLTEWANGLAPDQAAAARARGLELRLEEVVERALDAVGAGPSREPDRADA